MRQKEAGHAANARQAALDARLNGGYLLGHGGTWGDYTAVMPTAPKMGTIGWFDLTVPDAEGVRDFYRKAAAASQPRSDE